MSYLLDTERESKDGKTDFLKSENVRGSSVANIVFWRGGGLVLTTKREVLKLERPLFNKVAKWSTSPGYATG